VNLKLEDGFIQLKVVKAPLPMKETFFPAAILA
jgi:hypothetical protein